jgi:hypothetical protein
MKNRGKMEWGLVEEGRFGLDFTPIIFLIQFFLFIFAIIYFFYIVVDVLATRKKLYGLVNEFQEINNPDSMMEKLLFNKNKFSSNKWLLTLIENSLTYVREKDQVDFKTQWVEMISILKGRALKNLGILKWMVLFSLANTIFLIYDHFSSSGYGMEMRGIPIPLLSAMLFISLIYLKNQFSEILERTSLELQLHLLRLNP